MGIFRFTAFAKTAICRCALAASFGCMVLAACTAAKAVDLSTIAQLRVREQATAEVEAARQAVAAAQEKTVAARKRLDAFLEQHFELQGRSAEPALPQQIPDVTAPAATTSETLSPEAASLKAQLTELRAERQRLLTTLTEVHPEVIDVDGRIATVEGQLQALAGAKAAELPVPVDSNSSVAKPRVSAQLRQSEDDAAEFRELFSDWQSCEHALEAARADETKAIERLAALPVIVPQAVPVATPIPAVQNLPIIDDAGKAAKPTAEDRAAAPTATNTSTTNTNSQTFALGALAIALAFAALAAVLLARSGTNPLFASADDVAAALAVPVVGIVPASVASTHAGTTAEIRRFLVVVAQVVVAVAVFAAIAYAIQHVESIVHFCTNPVTSIRGWLGI